MSTNTVESLDVLMLLTADTERTAAFYRDVLGLELTEEEHDGRQPHYACRLGSIYFTIQPNSNFSGQEPGFPDQVCGAGDTLQLCFTVPDMEAFLGRLKEKQVEPLHTARPYEHTVFTTLQDPDGRFVRIMTAWRSRASA